jgi:hypothetical protein
MPLLRRLGERWHRENALRLESSRVFDVCKRENQLILVKRFAAFKDLAIIGSIVLIAWPIGNWFIYLSPANRGTWIGWVLLWCLAGPIVSFPILLQAWRARRGEQWVFCRDRQSLYLNDQHKAPFSKMQYVHVWQDTNEGVMSSYLIINMEQEPNIELTFIGDWEELSAIAEEIASICEIPAKYSPL